MVASMDVTPHLEGIDASTPTSVHVRHGLVLSLIALPPHLVIGPATLLPFGFCKHYLLSGARHQWLALLSSRSLECFASSYAGLRGP
jgi:hypothetical protein